MKISVGIGLFLACVLAQAAATRFYYTPYGHDSMNFCKCKRGGCSDYKYSETLRSTSALSCIRKAGRDYLRRVGSNHVLVSFDKKTRSCTIYVSAGKLKHSGGYPKCRQLSSHRAARVQNYIITRKSIPKCWRTFQRRVDSSLSFEKTWHDYENTFGDEHHNFWLGLRQIHAETAKKPRLRIEMSKWDGKKYHVEYKYIQVGSAASKYKLGLGRFDKARSSKGVGDSLGYARNRAFTTKDKDNDNWGKNCATIYRGGFWFGSCFHANPNGPYKNSATGKIKTYATGVIWRHPFSYYYSLKTIEMMYLVKAGDANVRTMDTSCGLSFKGSHTLVK